MMLLLVGAAPIQDLPLSLGRVSLVDGGIKIHGRQLDLDRGTATMMSVVCIICQELGLEMPMGLVAGDMGTRDGSMKIYDYLTGNLSKMDVSVMTFNYIMPDMKKNKEVLKAIDTLETRPILIADAGSMYVAKAGGDATSYDVFTPDVGEVAYLADEKAAHPTYTRGFIFHLEDDVPELIRRAYKEKNAARTLFVKGHVDYICQDGEILETVSQPCIEEMEPIGGTGDMITGTISGLIYAGKSPLEACRIAARVNRRTGELSPPHPCHSGRRYRKMYPFGPKRRARNPNMMVAMKTNSLFSAALGVDSLILETGFWTTWPPWAYDPVTRCQTLA